MRDTMKIKFAEILHVSVVVTVLAIVAIGFVSCGEKSHLTEIVITPSDTGMAIGTSLQLTGTGVLSNGVTFLESFLTWTSSNPDIATVDSTGLVTAPSATAGAVTGTITITATETDSHTYVSGSTTVTVCTVSAIAVTPVNPSMAISTTYQFTATATLSQLSTGVSPTQNVTSYMTWTSSNTDVATVDTTGIVTAGSVTGTATITATQGDSILVPGDTPIVAETLLTVTDTALSSIAVTAENDTTSITTGSTLQLTATGTYADATTTVITSSMTWSSSDTTIATVDTAGLVSAVGPGTATLTATDPITAVAGSIDITVN
jgi:uncharacterized protein YjdB